MDDNIVRLAALQERGCELSTAAEESIALEFAKRHANHLRFVAAWGRWLSYEEGRWKIDETLDAYDRARAICREIALARRITNSGNVRLVNFVNFIGFLGSSGLQWRISDGGKPLFASLEGDTGYAEHGPQLVIGDFHRPR